MKSTRVIDCSPGHIGSQFGVTDWDRVAEKAIKMGGGFVAFKPKAPPIPTGLIPAKGITVAPAPTRTRIVPVSAVIPVPVVAQEKPRSILAEVGPFLLFTFGITFVIWMADRERKKTIRGR